MLAELENARRRRARAASTSSPASTQACFYRAGTLALHNGGRVIARTSPSASPPRAPLAAVTEHGAGRVVVLADSDLFGDDCIGELDHESLWLNLVYWAAQPAFAGVQTVIDSPARSDPAWAELKAAVEELRLTQEPDGSVDLSDARRRPPRRAGRRRSPSAAEQPGAATSPTRRTTSTPCAPTCAPGSTPASPSPTSSARSRRSAPSATARDGIEHLVVFPMYKQNASRDTCFEALIVRVPWPDFVAELERSGYDNPKFVPVNFVDYTAGYDSECAVLFPETFSTAERPPSHFGGIFCDREAERFRRVCGAAAELLRPQPAARRRLPADLAGALRWTPTSSGT